MLNIAGVKGEILDLEWVEFPDKPKMLVAGREKRYEKLLEHCVSQKVAHLFTGHHKDDQVETVRIIEIFMVLSFFE